MHTSGEVFCPSTPNSESAGSADSFHALPPDEPIGIVGATGTLSAASEEGEGARASRSPVCLARRRSAKRMARWPLVCRSPKHILGTCMPAPPSRTPWPRQGFGGTSWPPDGTIQPQRRRGFRNTGRSSRRPTWERQTSCGPCGERSRSNGRNGRPAAPRRIGGPRWYWTCPVTGHRTERLYLVDGMGPASRQAHGLVYACQRETPRERAARRARKLRRHLGEALPVVGGRVPDQPPRMTPRVYGRLVDAVRAAEAQALAAIGP